jgi:ArsR family transcriptional regulator
MKVTDVDVLASQKLKAVADETRMSILRQLGGEECCVCDLTDALGIGQSLLSFHLRILKEAGLISDRREGRWAYYAMNADAVRELATTIDTLAAHPRRSARKRRPC